MELTRNVCFLRKSGVARASRSWYTTGTVLTQAFSHLKQKRYRGRDLPETRAPMEEDHDEE